MRIFYNNYSVIFLFFALSLSTLCVHGFADESYVIWAIGEKDESHNEFSITGNHEKYATEFPNGPTVQLNKTFDSKKQWSFIHPGPRDIWAGSKQHTFIIEFDLPPQSIDIDSSAYELIIQGWGHYSLPPILQFDMNGNTQEMTVKNNTQSDAILTDSKAAKAESCSILFPSNQLKAKGNVLRITNVNGSWFVYDYLELREKSGKIEAIRLTPVRGVFKTEPQSDKHGNLFRLFRKVKLDYQGGILPKSPVMLTVKSSSPDSGQLGGIQTYLLSYEKDLTEHEIHIPVMEEYCTARLHVEASLEIKDGDKTIAIAAPALDIEAERKWEVHIIHQTHLDIGYTHTQVDVLKRQVQSLRDTLKYIEETKDYPPEARFKFHPEGMWAVEEFFKQANDEEKAAFIKAARNRDIHLDVLYAQAMTGMYSDEELFELMGSALRFGREHGIEIDSAMQTDVPGHTWGLVPVLAKCGVRYMTMGPNVGHRVGRVYHWGEKPFWWESPSGKERVLCYLADTGYHMFHRQQLGHRLSEQEIFDILDGKDWHYWTSNRERIFPYDIVPLRYGIEGDNGRPNRVLSDVVKEWNEKYQYPKLIISRNSDFMKELEKRHGQEIPVVRGDYTPYWEDGAASTAEATGINRHTKAMLPVLETDLAANNPQKYREKLHELDAIWTDVIMYDEHTWGAHNSISAPDSDFVKQQDDYKQEYARRAKQSFERLFTKKSDVDNIDDFLAAIKNKRDKEIADALIKNDFGKPYADAEQGILGNDVLTVRIDKKTGAIVSLKRKGIEADLVNPGDDGNSGLNDYLYILGRNAQENRAGIEGDVKITSRMTSDGTGALLRMESTAPNCKSLVRIITVSRMNDSVQIMNILEKEMERRPEGTFFGFPFNVPGGVWRVDTPWAMVQVEKDQLPGANRNYYCVQRFCNISNDEYGIDWTTHEAPLVQFSPILFTPVWDNSLKSWREHIEPNGTIYSWVCNNHWETNYKAGQEGLLAFFYEIRPHLGKYDAAKSQRCIQGDKVRMLQSKLVKTDNENVLITRLKPTREGTGLFLRLYNPTDKPQTVSFDFVKGEKTLFESNPLEDRVKKIDPKLTVDPFDFISLRAE